MLIGAGASLSSSVAAAVASSCAGNGLVEGDRHEHIVRHNRKALGEDMTVEEGHPATNDERDCTVCDVRVGKRRRMHDAGKRHQQGAGPPCLHPWPWPRAPPPPPRSPETALPPVTSAACVCFAAG